jgi:uncharacterized protein YrrD
MKKGREFKHKPVIEVSNGTLLGYVQNLKIGLNQQLAGFIVSILTQPDSLYFLPLEKISQIGRDAILVREGLIDCKLVENLKEKTANNNPGPWVMTANGVNLGTIEDIVIEEKDGSIAGFEVSDGLVQDLLWGRKIIPANSVLTGGEEAVFIDNHYLNGE